MGDVSLDTGKKIRQENVNVYKSGLAIENTAPAVIENVMEDASYKRNNNSHVRVQASANGALNEMWATKVFEDVSNDEIRPRSALECRGVSIGSFGRRVLECRKQCRANCWGWR